DKEYWRAWPLTPTLSPKGRGSEDTLSGGGCTMCGAGVSISLHQWRARPFKLDALDDRLPHQQLHVLPQSRAARLQSQLGPDAVLQLFESGQRAFAPAQHLDDVQAVPCVHKTRMHPHAPAR